MRAFVFCDDASVVSIIRRTMNLGWPDGCEVLTLPCSDGEYQASLKGADFVFVDGDSLGPETVRAIRSAVSCPLIGLASLDETNVTVSWLLASGVDDYLYKPFSAIEVLRRLSSQVPGENVS